FSFIRGGIPAPESGRDDPRQISEKRLAADPENLFRGDSLFHDADDALFAGQCAEWHSRSIFSGLCGGAWNLFQTADLYLYAGKRNDPGHAADHRLQLRRRTV